MAPRSAVTNSSCSLKVKQDLKFSYLSSYQPFLTNDIATSTHRVWASFIFHVKRAHFSTKSDFGETVIFLVFLLTSSPWFTKFPDTQMALYVTGGTDANCAELRSPWKQPDGDKIQRPRWTEASLVTGNPASEFPDGHIMGLSVSHPANVSGPINWLITGEARSQTWQENQLVLYSMESN